MFRREDISLARFSVLFSASTNGSHLRLVFARPTFVSHRIADAVAFESVRFRLTGCFLRGAEETGVLLA